MRERPATEFCYHSIMGNQMHRYLNEKRLLGHRSCMSYSRYLCDFDRFLQHEKHGFEGLSKEIVERWLAKRPHEKPATQSYRRTVIRQFSQFLFRNEIPTYIIPYGQWTITRSDFIARIFTKEEIRNFFNTIDSLPVTGISPMRHIVTPEIFRLFYSCGLRKEEALGLKVSNVDLQEGVLTIFDGKFGKDRLVPMAPSMTNRLKIFSTTIGARGRDDYFFPAPDGGRYHSNPIYVLFRKILRQIGISHGGRRHGPRIHDFRHTFAVHKLMQWHHEGADLNVKLPILAAYMGHRTLKGTQRYLQLTPELFPEVAERFEKTYGHIIPGRCE